MFPVASYVTGVICPGCPVLHCSVQVGTYDEASPLTSFFIFIFVVGRCVGLAVRQVQPSHSKCRDGRSIRNARTLGRPAVCCIPHKTSRQVPLMLNPVPWCHVDTASSPKDAVESRVERVLSCGVPWVPSPARKMLWSPVKTESRPRPIRKQKNSTEDCPDFSTAKNVIRLYLASPHVRIPPNGNILY